MSAMSMEDVLVNTGLDLTRSRITSPQALELGARLFEQAQGTTAEKLGAVIDALLTSARRRVEVFDLPADLESMTKAELLDLVACEQIPGVSPHDTKASIVNRIVGEHTHRELMQG